MGKAIAVLLYKYEDPSSDPQPQGKVRARVPVTTLRQGEVEVDRSQMYPGPPVQLKQQASTSARDLVTKLHGGERCACLDLASA